jgi:exopolysaccharide biosynthesis protein
MIESKTMRLGVGITRYNKLLFVAVKTPCYLSQLGKVMRKLGCWDAVSVDAGSSSALYYRGSVLARPGRSLTNLLAVYDHRSDYLARLPQIAPWSIASL